MANLQTLALYLAAGIDVESPAWGRGRLVGLPCCDLHGQTQHAQVHFEFPPPDAVCGGVVELSKVKPVLYAPEDLSAAIDTYGADDFLTHWGFLGALSVADLEYYARVADSCRALGIALNLSPTDYIRKALPDAA